MVYFIAFFVGLAIGTLFHRQVKEGLRLLLVGIIVAVGFLLDLIRLAGQWLHYFWWRIKEKWAPRLDSFRKKLVVLAVLLFYVILAALGVMLLVAMGAGWAFVAIFVVVAIALLLAFLLSDLLGQVVAFGTWIAIMAILVWEAVTQFFSGFGNMLAELAGWIGSLAADLVKWLAALLAGITLAFPSCGDKQEPPAPPAVVTPIPQRFVVGAPITKDMKVIATLAVKRKEGCLRITERGGMRLTLKECRELAEEYDRKVEKKGRFMLAPNIRLGETWYLVEEKGIRKWIIPASPAQKR